MKTISITIQYLSAALAAITILLHVPAHAESPEETAQTADTQPARFVELYEFRGKAVLDTETGLVWQKGARARPTSHYAAAQFCADHTGGAGRQTWRLPTLNELRTLLQSAAGSDVATHHVFAAAPAPYWSSTRMTASRSPRYFAQDLASGEISFERPSREAAGVWCVRHGADSNRRWLIANKATGTLTHAAR